MYWSRCLDELHPIAVRILHHTDHHPGTHLRPRPHDLLTSRLHRAEHFIEVMDGHCPVAVPSSAWDTTRRGWRPRVLHRDHELDQTLPEPQAVHHLDADVLHRDVAFMHETEHIAIEGQHGRTIRGDDTQIDCVFRDFDSHRDLLLLLVFNMACAYVRVSVVPSVTCISFPLHLEHTTATPSILPEERCGSTLGMARGHPYVWRLLGRRPRRLTGR